MEKIRIFCDNLGSKDYKLAVFFHAWLMDQLESDEASLMHLNGTKPFTVNVVYKYPQVIFEVNLLTEEIAEILSKILLADSLTSFELKSATQKIYHIQNKQVEFLKEEELTAAFYNEKPQRRIKLLFKTPTSFKSQAEYIFYPDVRLLFQSLMRKYNYIFEGNENIDKELLQSICENVRISKYQLRSNYYSIHQARIPSFTGQITLFCTGTETLVSYVNVLLRFAEYAGIGIKTAMGMGAVSLE